VTLLAQNRFLSDDHITVLAKMYADQCGKVCDLVIETQKDKNTDNVLPAHWFEIPENAETFQITLRNRWNSHWEPVIRVFDVHDISHDGTPLDESSTVAAMQIKDSVRLGATQTTVAAQEEEVATQEKEVEVSDPRLASFRDHMGNEVTEKTKLVLLNIPKKGSPEWLNVTTGPLHSCQLVTSPGVQFSKDNMPASKDLTPHLDEGELYNRRSTNLAIRFGSLELNPWLEIQMVFYRSSGKILATVLHKSALRFFFGRLLLPPARGSTNKYATIDGISNLQFELSKELDRYLLSFEYGYAVPHNLYIPDDVYNQMSQSEKSLARLFRDLIMPSKRQIITFIVFRSSAEMDEGAECEFDILLRKLIKKEFGLTRDPYAPYLTGKGFVCLQANGFKTRMQTLLYGSPNMPVKARSGFADLIEAGVQIGFYTDL
jgi:hypothetical protein